MYIIKEETRCIGQIYLVFCICLDIFPWSHVHISLDHYYIYNKIFKKFLHILRNNLLFFYFVLKLFPSSLQKSIYSQQKVEGAYLFNVIIFKGT